MEKLVLSQYKNHILDKKGLAFVTLEEKRGNSYTLRGCIGYVEAVAPLKEIVARAAISAAFSDPRFPPLVKSELDNIIIEVTVLTKPEEIQVKNRWELPRFIKIGEDGLLVEYGLLHSGLLLPQVPVEYGWDEETFLAEVCLKADLEPSCWLNEKVRIKKFKGIIFRELEPNSNNIQILKPSEVKIKSYLEF